MQVTASLLREATKYAIAYHPDGDGFGVVNIFLNHLPGATVHLYSVDSSKRDFTPAQYERLKRDMAAGFRVIYLDLTPSNTEQLEDILRQAPLFYIDHHQIASGFAGLLDRVYAHNPRLFDPERAEAYAAGLQVYQIFGEHQADLPFLFISLFGDAKFEDWPTLAPLLVPQQAALAQMAQILSSVGLTKPLGPYQPERTDEIFEDAIRLCREAYFAGGVEAMIEAFGQTQAAQIYHRLQARLQEGFEQVQTQIKAENRAIQIDDPDFALAAILLKDAYKTVPFDGHVLLYQVDQKAQIVHYALMSKQSPYNCAERIRSSPYATGGGHTDRAGATGPLTQLEDALAWFAKTP